MYKGIIIAGCLALVGFCSTCVVSAQSTNARVTDLTARQTDLIAQLDKTKHKVKDKGSVHIEVYIEVRNEPVLMSLASLAGRYVYHEDADYWMDIKVSADGTATATGVVWGTLGSNSTKVRFTVKGKIDGALLTGTQTLDDGTTEPFEAVFANQTIRNGSNPNDATVTYRAFGIGFIQNGRDGMTHRVFMEKK